MNSTADLMTLFNPIPVTSYYLSNVVIEVPENKNVFHKIGKLTGKVFRFFRKSETKAVEMLS